MNVTRWVHYFVKTVYQAQLSAQKRIFFVLQKSKFWNRYKGVLNLRQEKIIQRMFKADADGFKGGMSTQKYIKITNCSKATATRDLRDLVEKGCLIQLPGGGRSTRCEIALEAAFSKTHF